MSTCFRFGPFRFWPQEGLLERDRSVEPLQPKVAALLAMLLERSGELLDKEELSQALWPDVHVQEGSLNQVASRLRRALGETSQEPRYLETRFKRGYRFVGEVVSEDLAPPAEAAPSPPETEGSALRSRRRVVVAVLLPAAMLIVLAVVWLRQSATAPPEPWRSRRLTVTPEREMEGSLARDGERYVYVANRPEEGQLDLFLGRLGRGETHRLTASPEDEYYPSFSPRGEDILFSRYDRAGGRSSLWLLDLPSGEARWLGDGSYGCFSPNGDQIAFAGALGDGRWRIVRRLLGGGEEHPIAVHPRMPVSLAWSPDGEAVAFTDGRALWVVAAAGGEARRIGEPAETVRSLAWTDGGESLLCDANWSGRANLWSVPLRGGPARQLTSGVGGIYHPAPAADGRRILLTQEKLVYRLVWFDETGRRGDTLALPETVECFDVDRTGRWLVWTDFDRGPAGSALMRTSIADGDSVALLGSEGEAGALGCPAIDVTGERVAVVRGGEPPALFVVEPGASPKAALLAETRLSILGRPEWSRRGVLVPVTLRNGGRQVLEVDPSSGAYRSILHAPLRALAASPDGQWLAGFDAGSTPGLLLVNLEDGSVLRLADATSFSSPPIWSADGRSILVLVDERSRPRLLRFDLAGHPVSSIELEVGGDPSVWGLFELRPAAAGWLGLLTEYQGDLYLLER